MQDDLTFILNARDNASATFDQVRNASADAAEDAKKRWQDAGKVIGAAMTAVGAAGLKMVSDARQMNAELGKTAITVGLTTKEMRNLALEVTDVTFPLQSVTDTFAILARAGIRGEEQMKAAALAFDALGDATGSSAEAMADMLIPAFRALGQEMPQSAEDLDKLTWLYHNTSVEISEFARTIERSSAEMRHANMTMDDAIAIMAALEAQGVTGRAAMSEFSNIVKDAADENIGFEQALANAGIELSAYHAMLGDATGLTQQYADVANEQYGIMDKLKHEWEKLTLQIGSFLTPLEPVLGLMTALGPVTMFLSTAMGAKAVATAKATTALIAHKAALIAATVAKKAATIAQWALNAAMLANPIGLIIAAIAGLIAAIIWMAKNWDKVRDAFVKAWEVIKGAFQAAWEFIQDKIIQPFVDAWNRVGEFFVNLWDRIKGAFQAAWEFMENVFKRVANFFIGILNGLISGFENFINFFVSGINALVGGLNRVGGLISRLPGIELPQIPTLGEVSLPRIPLLDTGGVIRGPGVFGVGPQTVEVLRRYNGQSGDIHLHIGNYMGDELSMRQLVRQLEHIMGEEGRRNFFRHVERGYGYGSSSI